MKTDYNWLKRWQHDLRSLDGAAILELGCGFGDDTKVMSGWHRIIVSADKNFERVKRSYETAAAVSFLVLDHANPLPFKTATFSCVLASLSLHYFSWARTNEILSEIDRVTQENACIIGRVNSTKDKNYGAKNYPVIEPGLYDVEGRTKRFFTEEDVQRMLRSSWQISFLKEQTIDRYYKPKVVWEFSARKTGSRHHAR
jgi:SAM-dependent methyltransferase